VLLGAQDHERDVRLVGVVEVAHAVARARRDVQLDHPGPARHPGVSHRRPHRDVLVQAGDVVDAAAGLAGPVDQRDLVGPRDAEEVLDIHVAQIVEDQVAAEPHASAYQPR
jgi:hypothetical protein